ncbi:hypothetical protein SCHPADRAFT_945586 [Schizopora paradoxa]|uniref:Uncharacterized protein n=1 Tax=Schizopora paradoxa TaxID=27342 RepID=A0A0H2R5E7_9AGAM|nr:hypothetical protein SCHPADRAFT_945586 [Schizopora paradoxa]
MESLDCHSAASEPVEWFPHHDSSISSAETSPVRASLLAEPSANTSPPVLEVRCRRAERGLSHRVRGRRAPKQAPPLTTQSPKRSQTPENFHRLLREALGVVPRESELESSDSSSPSQSPVRCQTPENFDEILREALGVVPRESETGDSDTSQSRESSPFSFRPVDDDPNRPITVKEFMDFQKDMLQLVRRLRVGPEDMEELSNIFAEILETRPNGTQTETPFSPDPASTTLTSQ